MHTEETYMNEEELQSLARKHAAAGHKRLRQSQVVQRKIDSQTLNMGHVSQCVLAQLFGSYAKGKRALLLENNKDAAEYGFWWHPSLPCSDVKRYYEALTKAWCEVLTPEIAS